MSTTNIDLIGDIHGHADELEALLKKMGYALKSGSYAHPERTVLFVGDYIDRGPKIRETLDIVRRMVESGNAIALMGNHEYNSLCYHLPDGKGGFVREHTKKNSHQHQRTLDAFQNHVAELKEYMDWFKTLPLYYETERLRAVHACWDHTHIEFLRNTLVNDRLTDELIHRSEVRGSSLNLAIEATLKGKEIRMPAGLSFTDKDGTLRSEIRIKWWVDPLRTNYRHYSVLHNPDLPDHPVDVSAFDHTHHYQEDDKPVFFGHYWLKGDPALYRSNICCLDYSVAKQGKLMAYRFDGEHSLDAGKLVYV